MEALSSQSVSCLKGKKAGEGVGKVGWAFSEGRALKKRSFRSQERGTVAAMLDRVATQPD